MIWLLPALALGADLSGRLVDDTTGDPIANASVEAWDPRLRGVSLTTGPDGTFSLSLETSGPWRLRAVPRYDDPHVWRMADGTADFCESTPIWLDSAVDVGDIPLPVGRSITGIVHDETGLPLPGATVWAVPTVDSTNFDRPAITDAAGAFEVVGLDTRSAGADWTLEFSADGWPEQYLGGGYDDAAARVVDLSSDTANVGEVDLLPGIVVGGTVWGPDGPVESGRVNAYATSQVVTVEVAADGTYEASGLPPGEVITWANSPGLAQTYFPDADRPTEVVPVLEEGAVVDDLDLFLPEQAIFEFELVDAETSAPIPGVGGLLYNDGRTVGLGNSADDDGILRIDRLHGGDWSLYVWGADEGYADDWIRESDGSEAFFAIDEGETTRVVLPLERSARVAGRVVDDDGAPVDGIAIAAIRDDGSGLATTTAPDGTFILGGIGAGGWTLSAEYSALCPGDPGYVAMYWPGTPNSDWSRTLTLDVGEQRTDLVFTVPVDTDLDDMADAWEETHGLDPSDPDDAYEDPDGDTYVNLDEYRMGTDPFDGTPVVEECGCSTSERRSPSWPWLVGLLLGLPLARRRP